MAKRRREARIKLQKLRIEEMLLEQRICEFEKISRQRGVVGWLRLRGKIVEFCRAVSNSRKLDLTLEDLLECVARRREELSSVDREVAAVFPTGLLLKIAYDPLAFALRPAAGAESEDAGRGEERSRIEALGNATAHGQFLLHAHDLRPQIEKWPCRRLEAKRREFHRC